MGCINKVYEKSHILALTPRNAASTDPVTGGDCCRAIATPLAKGRIFWINNFIRDFVKNTSAQTYQQGPDFLLLGRKGSRISNSVMFALEHTAWTQVRYFEILVFSSAKHQNFIFLSLL